MEDGMIEEIMFDMAPEMEPRQEFGGGDPPQRDNERGEDKAENDDENDSSTPDNGEPEDVDAPPSYMTARENTRSY